MYLGFGVAQFKGKLVLVYLPAPYVNLFDRDGQSTCGELDIALAIILNEVYTTLYIFLISEISVKISTVVFEYLSYKDIDMTLLYINCILKNKQLIKYYKLGGWLVCTTFYYKYYFFDQYQSFK